MIAPIAAAAKQVAGSVGAVEVQYLDLPRPVRLDCGRELEPVRVAYETYGSPSISTTRSGVRCAASASESARGRVPTTRAHSFPRSARRPSGPFVHRSVWCSTSPHVRLAADASIVME